MAQAGFVGSCCDGLRCARTKVREAGMRCDRCAGERFTKAGHDRFGRQLHRCTGCGRRVTARTGSAFSGYRFPDEVITLAVRWYLRYRLSYVEVAELLAERGVAVDPSTIYDWVQAFTPRFLEAARAHRARVGGRWRVDETLLKIGGRWRYAVRAGLLRARHGGDRGDAHAGHERQGQVLPAGAAHRPARGRAPRSSKYLNNGLER